MCGCIFQGRKIEFLPTQVIPRSVVATNSTTSLKRKREDDEDADLYGEAETTEKKPRGGNKDDLTGAELNTEIEMQTSGTTSTPETEVMEWLMFLVSENGELQVLIFGCNSG